MNDLETELEAPDFEPEKTEHFDILARSLRKTYVSGQESLLILDDVDLSIPQGSKVVISGESGAGKTSFLNLLAGLDHPDSGSLLVAGQEIVGASEKILGHYRQKQIGLVFQFHYLLKEFNALENVMLPAFMAGMKKDEAFRKARQLLDRVGLSARADHFPSQLSGGERQRAALARALINDPPILLADEPTGNLDERNARMVEELLFDLVKDYKKTLLLVTHTARLAQEGDIHLHLSHGKFLDSRELGA